MPELTPIGLSSDWLVKLVKRAKDIRAERQTELDNIYNEFGDYETLSKVYVEPDCQIVNPADHDNDPQEEETGPAWARRTPVVAYLSEFIRGRALNRDGRNVLFVLGDAGMGKTSLLMMLKFTHMTNFWPAPFDFRLLRLGPETLGEMRSIARRRETVLLLDALDEDPLAWAEMNDRLRDLLREAVTFFRVIITCRTQFFPAGGSTPVEMPGSIAISGYICNLIFLSNFNDGQVERYLSRLHAKSWVSRIKLWLTGQADHDLEKARVTTGTAGPLSMRPMLLAYIDDLMRSDEHDWNAYKVYNALVGYWLLREERKGFQVRATREELMEACRVVALHLHTTGMRSISPQRLNKLLGQSIFEDFREIDIGGRSLLSRTSEGAYRFSHFSIQEFLVVDALIHKPGPLTEPIKTTDLMVEFINAWVGESPRERLPLIPWIDLDLHEQYVEARQTRKAHSFGDRHDDTLPLKMNRGLEIFLCHSTRDKDRVRELHRRLSDDGFDPWLDEEKILPGQIWDLEIRKAVQSADVVIVCISKDAASKAGNIQKEIRYALDIADSHPEGTIFLIPAKLEECDAPERLKRWQWVNLFDDNGYARLLRALRVREGSS